MSAAGSSESLQILSDAGGTKILVSGNINERSQLVIPEGTSLGASVQVDTAGVTRINSLGVSNWIRFMKTLSATGLPISMAPLSVPFVNQARVISNFLGSATVSTYMVPYFCPECDHATEETFAMGAELPEAIPCSACKSEMEFDDEFETYLEFQP